MRAFIKGLFVIVVAMIVKIMAHDTHGRRSCRLFFVINSVKCNRIDDTEKYHENIIKRGICIGKQVRPNIGWIKNIECNAPTGRGKLQKVSVHQNMATVFLLIVMIYYP